MVIIIILCSRYFKHMSGLYVFVCKEGKTYAYVDVDDMMMM